jgi:hypothetical protein
MFNYSSEFRRTKKILVDKAIEDRYPRFGHVSFMVDNQIFILGGANNGAICHKGCLVYNLGKFGNRNIQKRQPLKLSEFFYFNSLFCKKLTFDFFRY